MDERKRLLEQAERTRRIAGSINDPDTAAALQVLAEEYARRAKAAGADGSTLPGDAEKKEE